MKNNRTNRLSLRKLTLAAMVAAPLAIPAPLWALPSTAAGNLTVSDANATVTVVNANTLNITAPDRTVLKWVEFGSAAQPIDANDTIIYNLPSSSASILNMVQTGATTIDGTLTSNGRILILNENGITVSATGTITASGATLSTRPETEFFFLSNGQLALTGTPVAGGDVSVAGTISVGSSGNVAIQANDISITGTIAAGTLAVTAADLSDDTNGTVTIGDADGTVIGSTADKYGDVTIVTQGGAVDLTAGAGNVTIAGGDLTVTTNNGNVIQGGAGELRIGDGGSDGRLTVNAGTGDITLAAATTGANNKTLTATLTGSSPSIDNPAGHLTVAGTSTGAFTAESEVDLTLNASTVGGNLALTSNTGEIKSGGTSAVTGNVSLTTTGADKNMAYVESGDVVITTVSSNSGNVTITSTTGDVSLPAITADNLTVKAEDDVIDNGVLNISGTATFDVASAVTLDQSNTMATLVLKRVADGATISNGATVLGKDTNATGNVTLNADGAVAFGAAAGDSVRFNGDLTVNTTNDAVTDGSDNTYVGGALTLATGSGAITLNGSTTTAAGLKSQYGQVNATTTGAVTVFEQTTLNLGAISAASLTAYSATGIVNTGRLNITGDVLVGAGTAAAPGDIALDFTSNAAATDNAIGGVIRLQTDLQLLGTATVGNYLARNVSIRNGQDVEVEVRSNVYSQGLMGDLSITTSAGNIAMADDADANTGGVVLTGKLTLNSAGTVTVTDAQNSFSNVEVRAAGATSVYAPTAYTVSATLDGANGNVNAATFRSGANLTLGAITSDFGGLVTFDSDGGTITDSATISIFGNVDFLANKAITIDNAGHSFGAVRLVTESNGNAITFTEAGTIRIRELDVRNSNGTITSQNGIIEQISDVGSGIKGSATGGTLTFSAQNGRVTLNDVNNNADQAWAITAGGNTTIVNGESTILGNITTTGTLTVGTNGVAGETITQKDGTSLNVFGQVGLTTNNAAISLNRAGNRLGALVVTAGNGNVTLREATTLNVKSLQTSGTVSLESENGSIIDTVDNDVANDMISNGAGATGAVTLKTQGGDIILDNPGTVLGPVTVTTTTGNVTLYQSTGNLTFAASTIGGSLTATTDQGGADITQTGALDVSGNVTLLTDDGAILLSNTGNRFGAVRFFAGEDSVLTESTTFNLAAGSVATGEVIINTNGDFVTSGVGGSSFTDNLTINAIGTITPGTGSLLVTGTFTIFSNNAKDLSGLSKTGNLAGKDPVNLGTGTYTPPAP